MLYPVFKPNISVYNWLKWLGTCYPPTASRRAPVISRQGTHAWPRSEVGSEPSCVSRQRPSVSQVLRANGGKYSAVPGQMEGLGRLCHSYVLMFCQPNPTIWKNYTVISRYFKANDAPGSRTVQERSLRRLRRIRINIWGSACSMKKERCISQSGIGISCLLLSLSTVCKLSKRRSPLSVSCHCTAMLSVTWSPTRICRIRGELLLICCIQGRLLLISGCLFICEMPVVCDGLRLQDFHK